MAEPDAPPPSYATATGSSTAPKPNRNHSHLEVPQARNGIPAASRRSMEDEHRPLPPGWVRQFDVHEQHQFFVDTNAKPPRSIWTHPYDDDTYLRSLPSKERERIQEEERERMQLDSDNVSAKSAEGVAAPLPPRPSTSGSAGTDKKSLGNKLKDKLTGTTKEERQRIRAQREEEERQYYEAHMAFRRAMQKAQMTGEPQFLAKDKDGRDVYIEPPGGPGRGYGGGYGGGYGQQAYGISPYSSGPYADPNARFIRPQQPYARPYGGGFGGGMGMPLAGGLMGGMLLGGLLF